LEADDRADGFLPARWRIPLGVLEGRIVVHAVSWRIPFSASSMVDVHDFRSHLLAEIVERCISVLGGGQYSFMRESVKLIGIIPRFDNKEWP
jgi:hypothetical protein